MSPPFITFTGVNGRTSLAGMPALAADYPVQFGFVLSPARQGTGRCALLDWVSQVRAMQDWGSSRRRVCAPAIARPSSSRAGAQVVHSWYGFIQGDERTGRAKCRHCSVPSQAMPENRRKSGRCNP